MASKIICGIELGLQLGQGSRLPWSLWFAKPFILMGLAYWCQLVGPLLGGWSCFLLLTTLTPSHRLCTVLHRHGDIFFFPWSWWPSSGNPAQMWNCRLGSWQLAARPWKKPHALFSSSQTFLGMPQNYPEPSGHALFHLTWLGSEWPSTRGHWALNKHLVMPMCSARPCQGSRHKDWARGQLVHKWSPHFFFLPDRGEKSVNYAWDYRTAKTRWVRDRANITAKDGGQWHYHLLPYTTLPLAVECLLLAHMPGNRIHSHGYDLHQPGLWGFSHLLPFLTCLCCVILADKWLL